MNMKTKQSAPKQIKTINVPLAPATAEATKEAIDKLQVVLGTEEVPNKEVQTYNHAAAQEKAWKKIKDEAKPKLEQTALDKLFSHNTDLPDHPVKTVCLTDSTGASLNVSLKDTYENAQHNPEVVTKGLLALGKTDPNKFVAEKVIIGFDTAVFYDANGALRTDFYLAVMNSLQDIAAEHGVNSPFSSSKVVTVKPGFAELRWKEFTEQQQPQVSKLFPATVSLTPIAPEKKPKS